jgi:hypothetical protein
MEVCIRLLCSILLPDIAQLLRMFNEYVSVVTS